MLGCSLALDARSAPGSLGLVREARLGCRDICSPTVGRMVRFGHDQQGLNHIVGCANTLGAMPFGELASWGVGGCPYE